MSRFNKRGFSMIEVMVAIFVLSIGLMAAAQVLTRSYSTSLQSKDMSVATMLVTEKMEDLARYPAADPHVQAPGGMVGSLTADLTQNITVGPQSTTINYFDDVYILPTQGTFTEVRTGIDPVGGGPNYTTTSLAADGTVTTTVSNSAPQQIPTFKRRWIIEDNQPVAGLKRVTVRVEMVSNPRIQVQMTMVRP